MYTLIICLMIVAILPMIAKVPLAYAMHNKGGYNNVYPRIQEESLTGFGARAYGGHQNSHEALILFSSAILTAMVTQNIGFTIQYLAVIFVISRVCYQIMYLINWATLRSIFWAIGWFSAIAIFALCL